MSVELTHRLQRAINAHDLDALEDCFEPGYPSDNPVHPARSFVGRKQMRRNWSQIFAGVPDITASLVRVVAAGDTSCAEWEWKGHRADGSDVLMRGVTIQGGRERAAWVRLYMEQVEQGGMIVDEAIRRTVAAGS